MDMHLVAQKIIIMRRIVDPAMLNNLEIVHFPKLGNSVSLKTLVHRDNVHLCTVYAFESQRLVINTIHLTTRAVYGSHYTSSNFGLYYMVGLALPR
jgi:hypothetical protein